MTSAVSTGQVITELRRGGSGEGNMNQVPLLLAWKIVLAYM